MTKTTTFKSENAKTIAGMFECARTIVETRPVSNLTRLLQDTICYVIAGHYDYCNCPNPDACLMQNEQHIDELLTEAKLYVFNLTGSHAIPSADTLNSMFDVIATAAIMTDGIRDARNEGLVEVPDHATIEIEFGHSTGCDFTVVVSAIEPGGFSTLQRIHEVFADILVNSTWQEYTLATVAGSLSAR
jgi:hypothetical protein